MTVSTTTNRVSYSGNDVTLAFAFSYPFLAQGDLKVLLVDADDVETEQVLTTDYTISGTAVNGAYPNGGTVNMIVAPATGEKLVIYRDPALTQGLDLVENDPMPAEELEKSYDRAMMIAQRLKDRVDRSAILSDGFTGTFDPTMPIPVADRALIFDATGEGFAVGPTAAEIEAAEAEAVAAAASAVDASEHATTASRWAKHTAGTVVDADTGADSLEYSSKEYAQGTQASTGGSAKNWSQQTGADVTGAAANSRSAKSWAQDANTGATLGGSSKDWAQNTSVPVDGTSGYSAKEHALGTQTRGAAGGGSAKDWANYTGGTVDDAEYSAKKYAQDTQALYDSFAPGVTATESIAAAGTIAINTNVTQNRKVQGNAAAVTTANAPFGTAVATDGIVMRLIGKSDTDTVTVPYADIDYGCLLNGDAVLGNGSVVSLLFDLTALRWYEISRNF